ncbi:hypothetical protein COLSTE_00817 [Collinsella stercoris DSM 13279]|uniref:Uncharacterized protein n=1 Tax=Collinsella stercoris DSM 13279 TaxID=445975 RepID=B6G9S6_9ACTN|nr:hypothetical protein COLSTE_00817 [Collinsella stercoris DSM 13279]
MFVLVGRVRSLRWRARGYRDGECAAIERDACGLASRRAWGRRGDCLDAAAMAPVVVEGRFRLREELAFVMFEDLRSL